MGRMPGSDGAAAWHHMQVTRMPRDARNGVPFHVLTVTNNSLAAATDRASLSQWQDGAPRPPVRSRPTSEILALHVRYRQFSLSRWPREESSRGRRAKRSGSPPRRERRTATRWIAADRMRSNVERAGPWYQRVGEGSYCERQQHACRCHVPATSESPGILSRWGSIRSAQVIDDEHSGLANGLVRDRGVVALCAGASNGLYSQRYLMAALVIAFRCCAEHSHRLMASIGDSHSD